VFFEIFTPSVFWPSGNALTILSLGTICHMSISRQHHLPQTRSLSVVAFARSFMGRCHSWSWIHDELDATHRMPHLAWHPGIRLLPGMYLLIKLLVLPFSSAKEIQRILPASPTGFRLLQHPRVGSESDEWRRRPSRLAMDLHHARHHHHLPRPHGLHFHRRLPRSKHAAPTDHSPPLPHTRRSRNHQSTN
jgi:hypothetical protein